MKQPTTRHPIGASQACDQTAGAGSAPSAEIAGLPNAISTNRAADARARRSGLCVWRAPESSFASPDRGAIQRTIECVLIPREPEWRKAVEGDASAAIGLAIRVVLIDRAPRLRQELALAALWLCAANGDATARMVLAFFHSRPDTVAR